MTPGGPGPRQSLRVLALLGVAVLCHVAGAVDVVRFLGQPGAGFLLVPGNPAGPRRAVPVTEAAARSVAGLRPPLEVLKIDGRQPGPLTGKEVRSRGRVSLLIRGAGGATRAVAPTPARPSLGNLLGGLQHRLPLLILGLLFLALGLHVWSRQPRDPAAQPLLELGCLVSIATVAAIPWDFLGQILSVITSMIVPFIGLAAVVLTARLLGCPRGGGVGRVVQGLLGAALFVAIIHGGVWYLVQAGVRLNVWILRAPLIGRTLLSLTCVAVVAVLVWRAIRRRAAPVTRRRAKVLAVAGILAFATPGAVWAISSATGAGPGPGWFVALQLILLASFPLVVGQAIIHQETFDLGESIRRGAIVVALAVAATLALDVVSAAAGLTAPPLVQHALVMMVLVMLLGFELLKRRRGARRRGVSGEPDAEGRVLDELIRAQSAEETSRVIRAALVDGAGLSRIELVVPEPGSRTLRRIAPGNPGGGGDGASSPLPARFAPGEFSPIVRAMKSGAPAYACDLDAVLVQEAASARGAPDPRGRRGEAAFWTTYGVAAVIPFTFMLSGEEQAGVLLLGPAATRRRPAAGVHALTAAISRWIGPALEKVFLLEEATLQNNGLKQQVVDHGDKLSSTMTDLNTTRGKLIESEKQAMLGRLVAGIVHEINSPLGTIGSSVDTLSRANKKLRPLIGDAAEPSARKAQATLDTQGDLIDVMRSSIERISGVMESLKRFVSLDSADIMPLDICQSIDDAVTLVSPSIGERIEIIRTYPDDPPRILCFPDRLNQVFLNLIQNAADAIEGEGEIKIEVKPGKRKVRIRFMDNGRGIPEEKVPKVLDFGFTMKDGGRVGLRTGLPSSKKAVVEIGGDLSVISVEGEGTIVLVDLPLKPSLSQRRAAGD